MLIVKFQNYFHQLLVKITSLSSHRDNMQTLQQSALVIWYTYSNWIQDKSNPLKGFFTKLLSNLFYNLGFQIPKEEFLGSKICINPSQFFPFFWKLFIVRNNINQYDLVFLFYFYNDQSCLRIFEFCHFHKKDSSQEYCLYLQVELLIIFLAY